MNTCATCQARAIPGSPLATITHLRPGLADDVVAYYCHPDQSAPTCYERASRSEATQSFVNDFDIQMMLSTGEGLEVPQNAIVDVSEACKTVHTITEGEDQ